MISGQSTWRCRLLAGSLILGVAALHVTYSGADCPLDLAPDEAHYWDWSRHLDWSYYSKGPLVAYLIRAGVATTGGWSQRLVGNEMLAVRLPAVICGSLLLVSLYILTIQVYRRETMAASMVALALTIPLFAAGSTLMTIDAPYTCCWGWALVFGYQAVFRGSAWAWPAAGVVVGLGILAKYTMVLWLLSLFLFLLVSADRRPLLWRPGVWVMSAIAATFCLPLILWNANHDWVGLRHVAGQARLAGVPAGVRWFGPLAYVGTQFGLLLGFWFVAWLIAMIVNRRGEEPGASYLWWMSAPVFLVFLGFSFATPGEPNWPVAAYISGFVLTVAWILRRLELATAAARFWTRFSLVTACVLGLGITVVMHHSELLQPVLAPERSGDRSATFTLAPIRSDVQAAWLAHSRGRGGWNSPPTSTRGY